MMGRAGVERPCNRRRSVLAVRTGTFERRGTPSLARVTDPLVASRRHEQRVYVSAVALSALADEAAMSAQSDCR